MSLLKKSMRGQADALVRSFTVLDITADEGVRLDIFAYYLTFSTDSI